MLDEVAGWAHMQWHTLRAWRSTEGMNASATGSLETVPLEMALSRWHLEPAAHAIDVADSAEPLVTHRLRWWATLPPGPSRLVVAVDFSKPVLHADTAPADASRGLDVGAAAVAYSDLEAVNWAGRERAPEGTSGTGWPAAMALLFTNTVVIPVPIADDSMPFNVIAITSTLVALFVGSMFGLLVKSR